MPDMESNKAKLLWHIVSPLVVAVFVLAMEYWTGLFHPAEPTHAWALPNVSLTITSLAVLAATLVSAIQYLLVSFKPHRYLREDLSFASLCFISLLTLLVLLCLTNRLMPWSVPILLANLITHRDSHIDTRVTDYVLLILLYISVVSAIIRSHRRWPGLKSEDQYQREQRNESTSLFIEGLTEFKRIIHRRPPLRRHSEKDPRDFVTQLEPVSDSLAWRDRAKELLRLSSSSYVFDSDSDWHDKEGCWIGSNVNTGELVFLFPCQIQPVATQLDRYIQHTRRVASMKKKRVGEVIIAVNETVTAPLTRVGIPLKYLTEVQLLDNLVDFKDYFSDIKRRATLNRLPDSDLNLSQVYVPSQFYSSDDKLSELDIEECLNQWLLDRSQKHLALLGEYGQGKSTAALMWAYHQVRDGISNGKRIPLVIELRGTSPRNLTPLQLFGAWAARYNINPQALMRLLVAGRLILIFEGFDEMTLVGDAAMRLNHFRTLWQFAYPKAKLLITGRPNFFLDEEEMKAALGISKPVANMPYCEALRLAPFSPDQICEALRSYKAEVRNQIHDLALRNERFRDIVSRPSLLHIVSVLWERERLFEQVERLTSAFVMDLFVRQSYRRQGLKEKDSPEFMALTTAEREYFMEGIAAFMGSTQLPNQISSRQLHDAIKELLAVIPDSVSIQSPAISGETNEPLRRRIENTEYGFEHVTTDVRACGLLVDDPSSPGTFRFGHKSFMEYLFAVVVADGIQQGSTEKTRAIFKAVNARVEDILDLPVAVDFLCELLVGTVEASSKPSGGNQLAVARHLLRVTLGRDQLRVLIRHFGVFLEIASYCFWLVFFHKRVSGLRRSRMTLMTVMTFGLVLSLFYVVPTLFWRPIAGIRSSFLRSFFQPLLMSFMMVTMLLTFSTLLSNVTLTRKRIDLWLRLCKGLDIPNELLHRVVGTWIFPRIKNQSLYEYVDQSKHLDEN